MIDFRLSEGSYSQGRIQELFLDATALLLALGSDIAPSRGYNVTGTPYAAI